MIVSVYSATERLSSQHEECQLPDLHYHRKKKGRKKKKKKQGSSRLEDQDHQVHHYPYLLSPISTTFMPHKYFQG